MNIKATLVLTFLSFLILSCMHQTNKSEISDAPCVIIKTETPYVVIGNYYRAEIILTCNKPDSATQISIKTSLNGEPYFEDGRIFWKYFPTKKGETIFKGDVVVQGSD